MAKKMTKELELAANELLAKAAAQEKKAKKEAGIKKEAVVSKESKEPAVKKEPVMVKIVKTAVTVPVAESKKMSLGDDISLDVDGKEEDLLLMPEIVSTDDDVDGRQIPYVEHLDVLIQKGRIEGMLTYEELTAFAQKFAMTEEVYSDVLRILEKENIDLISQEDLLADISVDDFLKEDEASFVPNKPTSISNSLASVDLAVDAEGDDDFGDGSDTQEKSKIFSEPGQLNDPVKLYLKEIGRIPLLNKETEQV
ncbi:MAG: sigma-70 factor domain-containing protein, partial [bacterium]